MVASARLSELRRRKELLVTQADLQRQLLSVEAEKAAAALSWLDPLFRLWQTVKPLRWVIAPVAGFLLARRGGGPLWQWMRRGLDLWQGFRRLGSN